MCGGGGGGNSTISIFRWEIIIWNNHSHFSGQKKLLGRKSFSLTVTSVLLSIFVPSLVCCLGGIFIFIVRVCEGGGGGGGRRWGQIG